MSNVVQYSVIKDYWEEVGVTNAEGPPVPIPNTEVKLCSGDNTWLEAAREDSSMPTQERERIKPFPDPEKGEAKPNNSALCIQHSAFNYGGVAQLGEHLPCKQGVMGSNPIISTKLYITLYKVSLVTFLFKESNW